MNVNFFFKDKSFDRSGPMMRGMGNDDEIRQMRARLDEALERNKKLESQVQKYESDLYGKSADKYNQIEVRSYLKKKKTLFFFLERHQQ